MRWLMTWASAEPVEVLLLTVAAVFAVLAVIVGIAAYRAWEASPPSTATSGSDHLF